MFNRRIHTFLATILVTGASLCSISRAAAIEAPDAMIRRLTEDVLSSVKADSDIQAGSPRKILALVDTKILPFVNFERMTQEASARFWAKATPEQRASLTKEFRTTLVRTYSSAVEKVKDQQVQMRPLRGDPNDDEVEVRSVISQPKGEPIQLNYRLEKAADGWKIYDVNVFGIWLVENYKNQFSEQVNKDGVDGLIKALAEKNRVFLERGTKGGDKK